MNQRLKRLLRLYLAVLMAKTRSLSTRTRDLPIRAYRLFFLNLFPVSVSVILSTGIIIIDSQYGYPREATTLHILIALLGIMIMAIGFTRFQHFVDRHALGIQHRPEDLIRFFSNRLAQQLDHHSLVQVVRDELLPSLSVRQSVLLQIDGGSTKPFVTLGVTDTQIPSAIDIPDLLSQTGKFLKPVSETLRPYTWSRLILPLEVSGKTIGFWLFGRRESADFYAQTEIQFLKILANQIAIALVIIDQSNRLHTICQANIDRHEEERSTLARELHDDVLGQLAVLSTQTTSTDSSEFQECYQQVTSRLRSLVANLRPAMLQYGLSFALDECIDEISNRLDNGVAITLHIPQSTAQYDPKVEEYLFRIVQHACENAVRHAQAGHIQVIGRLEPEKIHIAIEDDGIGFESDRLDFSTLMSEKHFGLVGMYERADLIGAELEFVSTPGQGTRISATWDMPSSYQGTANRCNGNN
jgi:signal transduction histidine kinase